MKKLVIAIAAIAVAVVAKAAAVDWNYQITGAAGGAQTEFTGYTAYLVDATYFKGLEAVTVEAITGKTGEQNNYLMSAALAQTGSSGKGASRKYVFSTNPQAYNSEDYTAGTSYDFYLVLVDAAGANYMASPYSYTAREATSTFDADAIKLDIAGSAVSSGMTAFATVPEPTSGLLMLLGMAGLALRRRRA